MSKPDVTTFYQTLINFWSKLDLKFVIFVTVVLYIFLLGIRWRLLTKSKRDHKFGESLLSETEPQKIKIKLI